MQRDNSSPQGTPPAATYHTQNELADALGVSQPTVVRDLKKCDCPIAADPPWHAHDLDALARWRDGRKLTRTKAKLCRWFEAVGWTPASLSASVCERYGVGALWPAVDGDSLAVATLHRNLAIAAVLCRVADRKGTRGMPAPPDPDSRDALIEMAAAMPRLADARWRELLRAATRDDLAALVSAWHDSEALLLAEAFGADPAEWPEPEGAA